MPGPGYFTQATIHLTTILLGCGHTFKELTRRLGTEKRERDRLCFQGHSPVLLVRKGATEGM